MCAVDALELHLVGAELVEEPQVAAFVDVVVVHRPQHRPEGIGVEDVPLAAGIAGAIAHRLAAIDRDLGFEEAGRMAWDHRAERLVVEREGLDLLGMRDERPQHVLPADLLQAQEPKGIGVTTGNDRLHVPPVGLPVLLTHALLPLLPPAGAVGPIRRACRTRSRLNARACLPVHLSLSVRPRYPWHIAGSSGRTRRIRRWPCCGWPWPSSGPCRARCRPPASARPSRNRSRAPP